MTIANIILPYLLLYRYAAIFFITFLSACALPIPPGTLLMASAAFASQGYLSFFWVVFWGSLGNLVGDNLIYFITRRHGKKFLRKIGFGKIFDSEKYEKVEKNIHKHSGWLIFISRFEVVSNLSVNILCGLGKVPYKKYAPVILFGEVSQVLLYSSIGYFVGDNWQNISSLISRFLLVIGLVVAVLIVIFWKKIMRKITK